MSSKEIIAKQIEVLYYLKKELEKKYVNYNSMSVLILARDQTAKKLLLLTDCLCNELDNCIKYSDFHRGIKYLALQYMIYEKIFTDKKLEEYRNKVDSNMKL